MRRQRRPSWKWNGISRAKTLFARLMRKKPTPSEAALWELLRRKSLGVRFHRQAVILGYIADFWCPKAGLIVEVDGPIHKRRRAQDLARDKALAYIGVETIRIENLTVLRNPKTAMLAIAAAVDRRRNLKGEGG